MNIDYAPVLAHLGFPIGWTDDEIIGLENLTTEQRATVDAAIAAYDPLPDAKVTATTKIRESCRIYIYAFYSQEKQLNIGADESARATTPPPALEAMYSHDDFLRMHEFKNEARVICNMACAEVETAGSIEVVAAVMTELEYLYGLEIPA